MNAGFLLSPILVGLLLLGAVVVVVILVCRKGPTRATVAGGLFAAVLLLLLLVTLVSVLSRQRATEVMGEQMARNVQAQMKMMARDPLFEFCPDSATAQSGAEDCAAESSSTSLGAEATDRQRDRSRDHSTRIEVTGPGGHGSSTEASVECRSDYDANPSAGTRGGYGKRVEIHQYDSDRPLRYRTAAYAVGAGAVSLLILLAYLFVDARPHGRYTWLRRGIWATAFVVVCLLLLWAGPLVR